MAAAGQNTIDDRNGAVGAHVDVKVVVELDNPLPAAVSQPQSSLQDTAHSQNKQMETPASSANLTQEMASNPTTTQTPAQLQPITRNTETVTGVHNDHGIVNQNYKGCHNYIGGQHTLAKSSRKTKSKKATTEPPAKRSRGRIQPPVTDKENIPVDDNAEPTASTSKLANSVKKVPKQSSSGKKKMKAQKKTKPSIKESKPEEFNEYAKSGPSGRLQLKSVQPHVIMGNVEKLMYRNDLKEATAELKRFFEQLHFQSHPNSEHFKTCAESVFEKRNPLRRALFLAAYACKGARENSNHEKTFDVAGQIFEIFDNLVKPLSGKEKDYAGVLDTNLLSKGAHAIDVAVCISRIMREIHEWGIADARHTGNSKTYSLRWIMASYEKTKHYTDAITFAKDKTSDYNGLHNENVVFIHTALGSCFRESSRYGEALTQYKKAKMSTKKILSEWDKEGVSKVEISQSSHEERAESRARLEKNLGFLHKYIGQVQRTLKRHSKASKLGTKAEV